MQDALRKERLSEREELLAELEIGGYLTDPLLEESMLAVPRHIFVPDDVQEAAYEDRPLPIGFGQTVSAPHMVAMMTSALHLERGDNVLEVGTGVGYHSAIVKCIVGKEGEVHSIEYMPELADVARQNLEKAGIDVNVHTGDGSKGWKDGAPYDAILVTCAIPEIPEALFEQLKDGGRFIAPVGVTRCQLMAGSRHGDDLELDDLGPCLFVNAQGELGEGAEDDDVIGDDGEPLDDTDLDDDDDDEEDGGLLTPAP